MTLNDELSQIFREEATELIEDLLTLITGLSSSEGEAFEARLTDLLRTAHNLKGAATTAGFGDVERLAHAFEGAVGNLAGTSGPLPRDLAECGVETCGALQEAVEGSGSEEKRRAVLARLASLGGEVVAVAEARTGKGAGSELAEASGAPGSAAAGKSEHGERENAVRVNTSRLDYLMGFVGDFLMFRTRLADRHSRQEGVYKAVAQLVKVHPEFGDGLGPVVDELRRLTREGRKDLLDFSNLTDAMNDTAKELRTVPLRGAVPIWRRIVRESNQICGKETRLDVTVGRIEIDRYVLERIADPLMHILRNAVDHGIEPPVERRDAGKPAEGRIRITAALQGAMIRLAVSDDGRGIYLDKIRRQAVARGFATQEAVERMSNGQVADFLFRAGFSTALQTSRISGRGVGMDVVRSQLEELGGNVEIVPRGALGGTDIVLWVPVSILSSEGLLARSGNAVYALPVESVARTLRVSREGLKTADGRSVVTIAGEDPIRVMLLSELMGKKSSLGETLHVVVLTRGKAEIGLIVDEVVGLREYVIQALPWNYKRVPGINGAIIEADGSVTMLVDVLHVFESAHEVGLDTGAFHQQQKVLLVDDSLSSRTLQRSMLAADGYDVTLASDGEEAWQLLDTQRFDLVVSDVQMPKMDGFELTRRIRGSAHTRDLPVILVTSLASPADRTKGADAGADDYLVKGTFDQNALLGIVRRYLGGK